MAVFEVFSHAELRRYKTSYCTKATVFQIAVLSLTIIAPLLIAFRSQGFWKTFDVYIEQPEVHYKHEVLVLIHTGTREHVIWSTYQNFNQLQQSNLRVPLVKSREADNNRDGKPDVLYFTLEMPMLDTESVTGFKMMLFFDYKLHTPIIDSTSVYAEAFDFQKIFANYTTRNISTYFEAQFPLWRTDRGAKQPFIISATVQYPQESIYYTPGFWQLIKWAWVQYVSILLVFLFVFDRIKMFVFQNQLVNTMVESPYKEHQR